MPGVCRFFVSPRDCRRQNCPFEHPLPTTTSGRGATGTTSDEQCRFYNQPSGCRRGDDCAYAHVQPTTRNERSDVIRQNGTDSSSRAQNHAPDVGAGGDAPAGSLTFAERHLVDLYGFKWPSDSQEVGEFLDALKIRRRKSQNGVETFNPTFKGFTLSDYGALMGFGFRPNRANWRDMLDFLEAYDHQRSEAKPTECPNYRTSSGCHDQLCKYAHPPPPEKRERLIGRCGYLTCLNEKEWEMIEKYDFRHPDDVHEILRLVAALQDRRKKCLLSSNGKYAYRFGDNLSEDAGKFNPDFYGFWHHDYHRVLDNNFTPCKDEWWDIMDFLKEHEWDFAYVMEDYDETSCDRPDCKLYRGGGGVEQAAWNAPENRLYFSSVATSDDQKTVNSAVAVTKPDGAANLTQHQRRIAELYGYDLSEDSVEEVLDLWTKVMDRRRKCATSAQGATAAENFNLAGLDNMNQLTLDDNIDGTHMEGNDYEKTMYLTATDWHTLRSHGIQPGRDNWRRALGFLEDLEAKAATRKREICQDYNNPRGCKKKKCQFSHVKDTVVASWLGDATHSLSNLSVDDVSRLPTTLPSNTNNQPFSWRSIQNDLENPPNVGASGGSFPTLNISKCFSNNIQSPREKGVVDVDFDDKSREETLGFTAADWQILVGQGFKPWSEVEDWQEMYNFLEEYHTNNETASLSNDNTPTTNGASSAQVGTTEELQEGAVGENDAQNGESSKKKKKRNKNKSYRKRRDKEDSEAADGGEDGDSKEKGVDELEEEFVDLDFEDESRYHTMGFSHEDWNILLCYGFKPWEEDWQDMYDFLNLYNSGKPFPPIIRFPLRPR